MEQLEPSNNIFNDTEPLEGVRNEDLYASTQPPVQTNPKKSSKKSKQPERPLSTVDMMTRNPLKVQGFISSLPENIEPKVTHIQAISRYDPKTGFGLSSQQLQDNRAASQPQWLKLANGFLKSGVTAGTVFLDGLLTIPAIITDVKSDLEPKIYFGLPSNVREGFWGKFSYLWDNTISQEMAKWREESEKMLPNYRTSEGKGTWADFLGDTIIKNAGFIVGMAAGSYVGGPWSAIGKDTAKVVGKGVKFFTKNSLKAAKASQITYGIAGAMHGAMAEAAVEAVQNSNEWANSMYQKLAFDYQQGYLTKEEYEERKARVDVDRVKMGNTDYVLNVPYLTFGNYFTFGRVFSAGYGPYARFLQQIEKGAVEEATKQVWKPVAKTVADAAVQGFEEINQKMFNIVSGYAAEDDFNRYFRDRNNYKAQNFANLVLNNFSKSFIDTYSDPSSWEEFAVGAILGITGVPFAKPVEVKTADGRTEIKWKLGMIGGIGQEFSDYKRDLEYTNEKIRAINNRLSSMEPYYRNLLLKAVASDEMNAAALDKNQFEFKNSEFKDMIADIQLFSEIGKLDDLKEMIKDWGLDDVESIKDIKELGNANVPQGDKNTVKNIFYDENGNPKNEEEVVNKIKAKQQEIFDLIDKYSEEREKLDYQTGGLLPKESLDHLTWMKMQAENWKERAKSMFNEGNVKTNIQDILVDEQHRINQKEQQSEEDVQVLKFLHSLIESTQKIENIGLILAKDNKLYNTIRSSITDVEQQKEFEDFVKCCRGLYNFNNKVNEYTRNPSKLVEDLEEEEIRIKNQWYDDLIETQLQKVESGEMPATEIFKSLRNTETTPEVEKALFERLKKKIEESENEELKKEYKKYSDAENDVDNFIKAVATTTKENISGLRNDLIDKYIEAGSFDDFKRIVEGIYKDKELSEKIFHEMEEIKKSASFGKEAGPSKTKSAVEEVKKKKETKQQEEDKDLGDSIPAEGPMPDSVLEELGITKTEAEDIQKVKQEVLSQTKTGKNAVVEGDGDAMNPETNAMVPEEDEPQDNDDGANIVTNWFLYDNQKYNVTSARDIHSKRLNPATPINQKLEEYGAFDFIDNGNLQKLIDKNDKKGIPTKVHYLIHNVKLEDTPFKQDKYRKVVLAVEVETGGVEIDGKSYQIVGVLGGKSVEGKLNKYARQQEKSAIDEYNSKKLKRYDSTDPENNAPEWYICTNEDNHNYVRKIYTGRFVKSTGEASSATTRSLGDVTIEGERLKNLERPDRKVGMGVVMGKKEHTFEVVSPNDNIQQINNFNALAVLEGSVWLLTQQSDGRMYPRYCYPKTASRFLADLGEDGKESNNIYKTIKGLCEKICDFNQPLSERIKAKYEIMRYLYMGPVYWIGDDIIFENALHLNGNIVSSKAFGKISIENGKEDAQKLMDVLFASSSGFRMQFDYKRFTDEGAAYVREVLKSDILETDLLQVENINSSFDMFDELPKTSDGKEDITTIKEKISNLKNRVIANPENKYQGDRVTFLGDFYSYRNGEWINESHPEKVNEYPKEVLDFAANPTSNITHPLSSKRKHSLGYVEVDGNFYPFTISSNREVDFLRTKKGTLYTKQAYNKLVKQIEAENQKIEEEQNEALQQEAMLNELLENGKIEQISTEEPEAQESTQAQPQSKEEFLEGLKSATKEPKETSEISNTAPSEIVNAYNDYIKNQTGVNNTAKETAVKTLLSDKDMLVSENTSIWSLLLTLPPVSIKKLNLGTLLDIRNLIVSKISSGSLFKESLSAVLNTKNKQEQLKTLMDILNECK